jgi:hypothetical protein
LRYRQAPDKPEITGLLHLTALRQRALSGPLHASTLNDAYHDYYNREDQQKVDESAHGVRGNQAKRPEDKQDNRNGFKHGYYS